MKKPLNSFSAISSIYLILAAACLGPWREQSKAESALITRWNFNQTNDFAPSFGKGSLRPTGSLQIGRAAGTGSSDPVSTGDLALNATNLRLASGTNQVSGLEIETDVSGFTGVSICLDIRPTASSPARLGVSLPDGGSWRILGWMLLTNANVFTNGVTFFLPGNGTVENGRLRVQISPIPGDDGVLKPVGDKWSAAGAWRIDMLTIRGDPVAGGVAPRFALQPASTRAPAGATVTLRSEVVGTAPITLQWLRDNQSLPNQTNSTLRLSRITAGDAGTYALKAVNPWGATQSLEAVVTVDTPSVTPALEAIHRLTLFSRPGEALTNRFAELVLHPGDSVTTRIELASNDPDTLELRSVGSLPESVKTKHSPDGRSLEVTWTPAAEDSGRQTPFEVVAGIRALRWSIYVPTRIERQLAISEILANPTDRSSDPRFNPLKRDLSPETRWDAANDEFVELVNAGPEILDLSEWTVSDDTRIRHRFSESTVLQPGDSLVIFGGPRTNLPPRISGLFVPSSQGGLGLNNSGDAVEVRNNQSNLVSRVVFQGRDVTTNGSLTRVDIGSPWKPHRNLGDRFASPGLRSDGAPWRDALGYSDANPVFLRCRMEQHPDGPMFRLDWSGNAGAVIRIGRSDVPAGEFHEITNTTSPGTMSLPVSGRLRSFFKILNP